MTLTVNTVGDNPQQPGITAEAYVPDQLIAGNLKLVTDTATITGGAAFQRGTVLGKITASGKFTIATSGAVDGSQNPVAILADYADATSADVQSGIYLMGEFNGAALTLGSGITLSVATADLRSVGIFVKSAVTAADPT